ncbi:MAG: hypothetical protein N2235_19775 [Fischerella sp.]|nr:hypothetical protein [Fischerella sp.]
MSDRFKSGNRVVVDDFPFMNQYQGEEGTVVDTEPSIIPLGVEMVWVDLGYQIVKIPSGALRKINPQKVTDIASVSNRELVMKEIGGTEDSNPPLKKYQVVVVIVETER